MAQLSPDAGEIRASSALLGTATGRGDAALPADLDEGQPSRDGRPVRPTEWPLWSTHLVVPLGLVALGVLGAFTHEGMFVLGPVLLCGAVLAALAVYRPRPVAAVGVAGWFGVTALVTVAVMLVADTEQWSLLAGLAVIAVVGVTYLLAWTVHEHAAGGELRTIFWATWRATFDPPRWIATWIIGAGVGLPLLALYAPMITDADSAWIVVSTNRVEEQGLHLLQVNQDVFLPHLVIGPLLRWGGYPAANAFAAVSVIALLALGSALACWLTKRPIAGFVSALTLLAMPEIAHRADKLPMYAVMLICGYGGGWLIHRTMTDPPAPRWWAAIGGLGLVLAYEAHSVGQLFLLVPFLLLILNSWRRARAGVVIAVGTMLVASIPRVIVNFSIGGFDRFRSNYTDWLIQKGYLRVVNQEFWGQKISGTPIEYFANVPSMVSKAFGWPTVAVFAVLAVAAAWKARLRTTVFCVASVGIYLAALTIASPGTYARYLTPLSLGLALVAGVGVVALTASGQWLRRAAYVGVAVLVSLSLFNITKDAKSHQDVVRRTLPLRRELTAHLPPGAGVIGVRSHDLVWVDPNLRTEFSRTMTEKDFITYLTWPSDAEVLRLMRKLDVEYIVVNPHHDVEYDYHQTWLRKYFDDEDRHGRVRVSPQFCLVTNVAGYRLYRAGPCPGG